MKYPESEKMSKLMLENQTDEAFVLHIALGLIGVIADYFELDREKIKAEHEAMLKEDT